MLYASLRNFRIVVKMTFCYKTLKTLSHVSWIQNDALVHQGGLKGCNKKLYNSLALHQEGLKGFF